VHGEIFTEPLRSIFIEETDDGLEAWERGLLRLDAGCGDREVLDAVFRAAHSIKGGAATFGIEPMVELTHRAESLLDEVRSGHRTWCRDLGSSLLAAVDELRGMVDDIRANRDEVRPASVPLVNRLNELLGTPSSAPSDPHAATASGHPPPRRLAIEINPRPDLMASGNDPYLLLRELERLGNLEARCRAEGMPSLAELEPEGLFLRWDVELTTTAGDEDIREVFAWVEDECEIHIEEIRGADPRAASETGTRPAAAASTEEVTNPSAPPGRQPPAAPPAAPTGGDAGSIRVDTRKVDALVDLVGELIITQSVLSQSSRSDEACDLETLRAGLQQLERHTRELQERVMRIRMLPIQFVLARLPRLVRDLGEKLGKSVRISTAGEGTELDKTVLEKISDPLLHLVRNCIDHGIEVPEERSAKNKPESGIVHVEASHHGGTVVIEVRDDGAGIDPNRLVAKARAAGILDDGDEPTREEALELIFHPGLSTADRVSDISGRGVGMDVVRRNVVELGGTVDVTSSAGEGTRFTIRLPLTLAILDGQLLRVADQTFVLPLASVVESFVPRGSNAACIAGSGEVYRFRNEFLPLLRLSRLLHLPGRPVPLEEGLITVAESPFGIVALAVDGLLGQQQVVIKSLERNYGRVEGVAGATILGNGSVALILDVGGLVRLRRTRPDETRRTTAA